MPLTLAHPAAVLPLRRLGLPLSAMIAGSMVPDLPVFAGEYRVYAWTHAWWGVLTVDVVLAVLAMLVWFGLLRDALVDLSPPMVRNRLTGSAPLDRRVWWLVPVGAALGAATHVGWDAFTHGYGWGTRHIAWLRVEHLGLEGYRWVQYTSGVLGLVIVVAAAMHHLARLPVVRDQEQPRALSAAALPAAIGVAVVLGLAVSAHRIPDGLHRMAFDGVVATIVTAGAAIIALAVAWRASQIRD